MADMKVLRSAVASMCDDLVASGGVPFESTTELQRQMLASFAFGMTFVIGQIEHLTPPEVHALSITMLMDVFKFSGQQAAAFSSHLTSLRAAEAIQQSRPSFTVASMVTASGVLVKPQNSAKMLSLCFRPSAQAGWTTDVLGQSLERVLVSPPVRRDRSLWPRPEPKSLAIAPYSRSSDSLSPGFLIVDEGVT